jgi:hypothetical protein
MDVPTHRRMVYGPDSDFGRSRNIHDVLEEPA